MGQGANNTYLGNIKESINSLFLGLKLTIRHFFQARESRKPYGIHEKEYFQQETGIFTLQYPKESIPVPDNGRYKLHNEIEDCIVCDKCAKICPVDCIDIEPIKAVEEIGKTSDGTPKRLYAAKFDIDMAKCCFCGLCTTVCPTECLTMTKSYDFSEFDVADHVYAFSEMTPLQILEKKEELEKVNQQKELVKAEKEKEATKNLQKEATKEHTPTAKPAFKPRVPVKPAHAADVEGKPEDDAKKQALELMRAKAQKAKEDNEQVKPENTAQSASDKPAKPVFKPRVPVRKDQPEETTASEAKKEISSNVQNDQNNSNNLKGEEKPRSTKPVFKPRIPVKKEKSEDLIPTEAKKETGSDVTKDQNELKDAKGEDKPKPARPVFKPKIPVKKDKAEEIPMSEAKKELESNISKDQSEANEVKGEEKPKPAKPVFKPRIPIKKNNPDRENPEEKD